MRWWIIAVALLLLYGCDDSNPVGLAPSPSPSPTPSVDDCKVIRTDITVDVKGKSVSSWALGQIATATANVTFKTEDPEIAAQCPALQHFHWRMLHFGDPICIQQGNLDARVTQWVCKTAGYGGVMQVIPDGFEDADGIFSFTVLAPEA